MFVWASTRFAIEDAWKEVLGTVPKAKRFHTCKEGELVRVSPQGEKTDGAVQRWAVPAWSIDRYYYSAPAAEDRGICAKRLGVITGGRQDAATGLRTPAGSDWWRMRRRAIRPVSGRRRA